jgi:hypothetical protein
MNDPVFLDSAAFLRVWKRVTGEAGITAAPVQPEPDAITAKLRECICAKAAGTAFYAALAQRVCALRQPLAQLAAQERAQLRALQTEYFLRTGTLCVPPAACPRLSTAAADLRCIYWQELALSAQLDAAADAVPMPLRETLRTMAQQDALHAQRVRTLLIRLIF